MTISIRRVVTGVAPDGRSTLVTQGSPAQIFRIGTERGSLEPHAHAGLSPSGDLGEPPADGGFVLAELWETDGGGDTGRDPETAGAGFELECPAGGTRLRVVVLGPHRTSSFHRTETVDYDVVLDGSVDLVLEDGSEVHLGVGDLVVLPAVNHQWRTGAQSCTMAVSMHDITTGS
jgi:hypothetical protein